MKKSKKPAVMATVEACGTRPFTLNQIAAKSGTSYATARKVVMAMVQDGEVTAIGEGRKPKRGKAAIRYQRNGQPTTTKPTIKSVRSRRSPLDRALALAEADLDRAQALVDSLRQAKRLEKRA